MVALAYQPGSFITVDEYLEIERQSEEKHEYVNGRIWPRHAPDWSPGLQAMAGASTSHNRLTANLTRTIGNQLRDGSCETMSSDMRVRISAKGLYAYPDVLIVCPPLQFDDEKRDTLLNPSTIIEVLSESTQAYDRGDKFAAYRTLESLRDYLLVSQNSMHVEHFARQSDNSWVLREYKKAADECVLTGATVRLIISEIYERVTFEAPHSPTPDAPQNGAEGNQNS